MLRPERGVSFLNSNFEGVTCWNWLRLGIDSPSVWVFVGELSSQSAKSIERYVADQQSFRKATAGVSAVVMLAGLLQLENSNLEDVPRMMFNMFNALSRDAYRFAPTESTEELQF